MSQRQRRGCARDVGVVRLVVLKKRTREVLVVALLLSLLAWLVALLPTVMMFDAPGSEDVFWTRALANSIFAYGPVTVVSLIGAAVTWRKKSGGYFLLAPFGCVFLGALSLIGLLVFCGGNFAC